jgi:hypothetical protein
MKYEYTANEGLVRIQYKRLVPIYAFPETKLRSLVVEPRPSSKCEIASGNGQLKFATRRPAV